MDMFTSRFITLIGVILMALCGATQTSAQDLEGPFRSATLARDINGIALGTHIHEVGRVVRLEALGGGDYDGWQDGFEYDFGVTPLGNVYRIGMTQNLGRFLVDATFVQSLQDRLFAKYGSSNGRNPWGWQVVEMVADKDGNEFPQEANWMSVLIMSGYDEVELSMTMLDFRILWRDIGLINNAPRGNAINSLQF